MTSYDKYLLVFDKFYKDLIHSDDETTIRKLITDFMFYLEKHRLIDRNYLEHNHLFLACEVDQEKIKDQSSEILLSFLTMIYRIDYIDPNSDAFMIYYKNKMLEHIMYHLILKMKKLKGV